MEETTLHHLIFRIITIALIFGAFYANIFSTVIAYEIMFFAASLCVIWTLVNEIIICIQCAKDKDFIINKGLILEPGFFIIMIILILQII